MRIRILSGTYGHRPSGGVSVEPKHVYDLPFEAADEAAAALIRAGIAAPAEEEAAPEAGAPQAGQESTEAGADTPPAGNAAEGQETASEAARPLETLTVAALREQADAMGLDTAGCRKKADYIALIREAEAEPEDDGEAPPDLRAEAPTA